jgi:hypothetical protein
MKNLNSPLHNGLGDLFKGIFSAAEGAVKGVVQAGTGIVKGVTDDIKEGIEQVKENRANRQSQKKTSQDQTTSDDDKKKKTDSEKIGDAIGGGFKAAGERMGGHIDRPDIIQTSSTSGEQSTTVPDVTTIITSKESNIKPIPYTKKSKRTTSKWGFDYDEEEDNPITKKSGFKMKKSPYKNYKKGYYGIK